MKLETEEVELFRVYKKNGQYNADNTIDVEDQFGLFGFLKIILKDMEEKLLDQLENKGGEQQ